MQWSDWGPIEKTIKKPLDYYTGRHVIAARDIPVGEMLVVEEPLCSILAPEKLGLSSLLAPWIVLLFCRRRCFDYCLCCHIVVVDGANQY